MTTSSSVPSSSPCVSTPVFKQPVGPVGQLVDSPPFQSSMPVCLSPTIPDSRSLRASSEPPPSTRPPAAVNMIQSTITSGGKCGLNQVC